MGYRPEGRKIFFDRGIGLNNSTQALSNEAKGFFECPRSSPSEKGSEEFSRSNLNPKTILPTTL